MDEIDSLIQTIRGGIDGNESIDFFLPYFRRLTMLALFAGMYLKNDYFYRIRRGNDKLFLHIDELKYPPKTLSRKGRLNDDGESVAYMSLGEISPLAELDIAYYEIHCLVTIQYIKKEILFHVAGLNGQYETNDPGLIRVNEFYRDIFTEKDKRYYNATIALARIFLRKMKALDGGDVASGLLYSSAHNDKSNQNLHNVAVYSDIFDDHFRVAGAKYQLVTYDPVEDCNRIEVLNEAMIDCDGNVTWELSYEEMMSKFSAAYSSHIFLVKNEFGEDFIIHYEHGGGKVVDSNRYSYAVDFPKGNRNIMKDELNPVGL